MYSTQELKGTPGMQIAALRQQYTVYALDLRGHGASETGSLPFTALAVEDVLAVVDQLRLTSPVAVGHSIGGTLAARAEQLRPGLWSSLFLYEPVIGGSVEQVRSSPALLTDWRLSQVTC